MRRALLVFVLLAGCAAIQARPKSGQYCYKWADAQGTVHTTCKPTLQECLHAAAKMADDRPWYHAVSACDPY